jgi:hypothetical protein
MRPVILRRSRDGMAVLLVQGVCGRTGTALSPKGWTENREARRQRQIALLTFLKST